MTTTGQKLIASAKEALRFARGEANECVVNDTRVYWSHWQVGDKIIMHYGIYKIDTDAECPVIPVHDMGDL